MKLLRVGEQGKEIPAIIDSKNNLRNLSKIINDFTPENLNFEILDKPSSERTEENPWPYWPFTLKTSSSHEEGIDRKWSIMTKEFIGDENKNLTGIKTVAVDWKKDGDKRKLIEIEGLKKFGHVN